MKTFFVLPPVFHRLPMWVLWALFYAIGIGLAIVVAPLILSLGDFLAVSCDPTWLRRCALGFQVVRWGTVALLCYFLLFIGLAILDSKKKRKSLEVADGVIGNSRYDASN